MNEPLSDDVACLDIEDASKSRPSDDQVMLLIKEKTGATNSSAFQQLPAEIKKSVLIELKGRRASLRQLERLTGIGKSMIYRMGLLHKKDENVRKMKDFGMKIAII